MFLQCSATWAGDAKADTYLNAAERSAFEHGVSAEEGATARRLSQVLGREILFIDADADFHGCTIDGVIYLGAKSERSVLATVAHEYTHLLEGKGLYKKLRDFVFGTLAGEGATAEDLRAAKRAEHELYAGLDDAQIDREIVAEFVETRLLTDEQVMRAVVRREGKSFARRLLDTLRGLIEKVKAALHIGNADAEQLKMLERGRDILAEIIRSEETAEKTGVEASGGMQLLIARSDKNIPVLVIDADIAKNKTGQSDLIREVKDSISKIPYVAISKQRIYFTSDTKRETTFSKYSKWLKSKAADVFIDKMRAVYNLDELVLATTDYVNEGLKHPRKDNIVDFARGRVLMDILGKQYTADVVVGFTDKGICELHDVVNINPTQFGYKKTNDALSTISSEDEHLQKRTSFVNTTVSQNNSGVNSKYTQNSKKDADIDGFSVGGVNAKTAEVGRLADAERMEQGGADSETVRRQTGLYRGYDGKWRFEIDDSKMRFINHREESRRTWKLDELIRHDALFAAYPELRDYTVLNFGISDDVEAAFYPGLNRITLDPRLSRAEKRTALIHEIQHAIQLIESFTAGATTDHWRGILKTDEERRLEMRLRDFYIPDNRFWGDMRKLLEETPAAEQDAARAALAKRYGEAPVREYVDLYNRLRDLRAEREQDAERAYRNTAGEIEASDVANRIGLSEMQRAETRPDIDRTNVRFSNEHPMFTMEARQTDADTDTDAEVSDADKRFALVESAIKLLKSGADLWRTLRETGASPREIALRMATSGESDTAIRELTGLYRDALGVWTYDKAWFDAHVPDIADTRELRAGYKLGTVDEQLLGLAPEEVKASRRRLLDSAKLPADADAARVRQTAANLHRGLRPTAAEFAEDRKTAAAKEAARLITAEKVPSADAAIRTGALLADIADVLEKKKVRAETITRLTAQVRGENGAWETDNAAMTKIIRAGSKQLDVQDFTDFLFENAKELTESSYNSQYGHKETYALDKLGVQIQNPIVDIAKYGTKPSELIANEREQEKLKRYIENEYANAAHPTTAERADARDVKREFLPDMKTVGEVARFYLDRTKWRMLYCVCI